jgi:hypothetical protein
VLDRTLLKRWRSPSLMRGRRGGSHAHRR